MSEVERLLRDWIVARLSVIGEFSVDFNADWRELIELAQSRCQKLGITWNDEFIPSYVWESLAWADEDDD